MNIKPNLINVIAIIGNTVFILWLFVNSIDEGFKAKPVQLFSYIALISLLVLNIYIISKKTNN